MKNYTFKRMILLILLSGVIISAVYFLAHKGDINRGNLLQFGHGIIMTAGLWLGTHGYCEIPLETLSMGKDTGKASSL